MDAWDVLYANGGSTNKDAWDLLHSVHVVENNSPIYVKIEDKTSATVTVSENAKVVTVKGGSTPHISVSYTGGRGPIWLPGNSYDGTSLAAILAGYIGKQQLSNDLSESLTAMEVGLDDAVASLSSTIQSNALNGERLDAVVSRMDVAEGSITSQVSRLNAAEANISTTRTEMDGHEVRLSVAEGDLAKHGNYIATQESILKNEWTVKIQENADGTAYVAGTGLLVYPAWNLDTVYDVDDYVWFDDHAYKAIIAHTATESNVPPNGSYWTLIPYATKSQFGVLAESFFVQTSTGGKAIPFIVQDDQVMINGDLTVNGLIEAGALSSNKIWSWSVQSQNYVPGTSGYSIDALTGHVEFNNLDLTINYSSIVGAPDTSTLVQTAIDNTLDTTTGGIIVRDTNAQRYAHLTGGDLDFYDLVGTDWRLSKSVTDIRNGICQNGTTVNIGYFRSQPKVILSPYNLQSYAAEYSSQSQTFKLEASNLRQSGTDWVFDAVAQLNLASGVASQDGDAATGTLPASTGSGTYASTIKTGKTVTVNVTPNAVTLPANSRQVSVNVTIRQQYTFVYVLGVFKTPVGVSIALQYLSGGSWVTGATSTLAAVNCSSLTERTATVAFTLGVAITSVRIVATFTSNSGSTATIVGSTNNTTAVSSMYAEITQVTSQQAATVINAAGYASYLAIG